MKINSTLFLFFLLGLIPIQAQIPGTPIMSLKENRNVFGGSSSDVARSAVATTDGGYAVAGYSSSSNGDVSGNNGSADFWILKVSSSGNLQWKKTLGGSDYDEARSIVQTADGGYAIAGVTASSNGDVSGNHGGNDFWVVKLDSSGALQWQKTFGGPADENAYSIVQTSDGGYAVAGYAASNSGDVSGNLGGIDFWVVKLDNSGTLQWQKTLGGSGTESAQSIIQTTDGGYAVAGYSDSTNGDAVGNNGNQDYLIIKLSSTGNVEWHKVFGGTDTDIANAVIQTADGGFALAGYTLSNNGNVSGNQGMYDSWVIKLDNSGTLQWQKTLGGSGNENTFAMLQDTDGTYIVAGDTRSNDGNVSGNHGGLDAWVVKLSTTGNLVWQKALGGTLNDSAAAVTRSQNGYTIAGRSSSNDGDIAGPVNGSSDFLILKMDTNGTIIRFWDDTAL
ncbi:MULTISPECIES: hypothetical protein [Chryseobacterium]|uniref:T9SS C-terminal target domain-containing protein n=1 Tax=Chryseobacterium camelliae TaxID=1265445 RepID=A0ABU0TPJ5_9FLAO|nr:MULTISPECIES: hypothetical protein [Chryseobacterium]MDT3407947.1 hypothetical protein [Pseudacidovorax intermedius]MDQ1098193.1 hypothetical protein [Chryseobacterium camelliae]MDQ1102123.1 hypothetical protein [Chryseobacterium sp. SORGH_AS_1048]MDR6085561.1 hypothetical protein [Chryseobacterium sp. SORGH_AS_0909]MDR6129923.1 hypothetical protein [Chryseobacterium sp. SORGH_AS_1175]